MEDNKYKEALERARVYRNHLLEIGEKDSADEIEYIFPELKESEDERIRKNIIADMQERLEIICNKYSGDFDDRDKDDKYMQKYLQNAIAWLEKQGEQKSWVKILEDANIQYQMSMNEGMTKDAVNLAIKGLEELHLWDIIKEYIEKQGEPKLAETPKPKFKVGDWVIGYDNISEKISDFQGEIVLFESENWVYINDLNKEYHLWTIQDVKPGDVLATLDYILIFKECLKEDGGVSYCHYDFGANNPQFFYTEDNNWYFGKEAIVYPAAKEQRNLLFQKMHEAGYEWDAGKLELKKIEQKMNDKELSRLATTKAYDVYPMSESNRCNNEWNAKRVGFQQGYEQAIKDFNLQKPIEWSGEDEYYRIITYILNDETVGKQDKEDAIIWFKSLPSRMGLQSKQEWSEEDETHRHWILEMLKAGATKTPEYADQFNSAFNWLKSLRPQSHWKPSEEQMEVFDAVINSKTVNLPNASSVLKSLYNDLKKL